MDKGAIVIVIGALASSLTLGLCVILIKVFAG